jgi:galactose mutarotase-like enzyme
MEVLENDYLKLTFKLEGSEWTSLINKKTGLDYAWRGDERYWAGRNPTLFPIVGKVKNDTYRWKGQEYHLGNHGFARTAQFALKSKTATSLQLELMANEETKRLYPFDFRLINTYTLSEWKIRVVSSVRNLDKIDLPFSIGAHPAFNCPLLPQESLTDYQIVWEKEEQLVRLRMNPDGTFKREREEWGRRQSMPLSEELFADDVVAFEHLTSGWVKLQGPKAGVTVSTGQAPWFGIWKKPGAGFVCLEPWQGHGDFADFTGELDEREGMIKLPSGVDFDFEYEIGIE